MPTDPESDPAPQKKPATLTPEQEKRARMFEALMVPLPDDSSDDEDPDYGF